MEKETRFNDYVALVVFAVMALFKGVWKGLKQIPTYVRAEYRSSKRRVEDVQKYRATGKTARERYMDRVHGNRN